MPTTNADQPQGPSLEDAARRMEGLLDLPDEADHQAPSNDAADAAPADTDESVAPAEATSEETPAADEEAEVDKAEATETEDDSKATEARGPQTITVTIDGKTETITLDEARHGYQRYSDYTRKTTELAQQRQAAAEERQTYAAMLVALRDQLQQTQSEGEPNWDEVYKTDPVGYARRRDEWRDKQEKMAAANFELQRLQSLQQKENEEKLAQHVAQSRQKMLDLNPAWKDQKVWESDRVQLVQYARTAGYTPEEISQAYDPRAILLLHKARLYDELMSNKPKPAAVRGPRVASAGAAQQPSVTRLNAAQQRLAKSGRIADAAKVFEQLI